MFNEQIKRIGAEQSGIVAIAVCWHKTNID